MELPLFTLDPSKDTVLHILDIPESWPAEQALTAVMSEMDVNIGDHQIAYKTSKMKVKDNAIIIDGPDSFAAGLAVQRSIQSHAFEQKRLKMFNLVSSISFYSLQLLHK